MINISIDTSKAMNKINKLIYFSQDKHNLLNTIDKSVLQPAFIKHLNDSRNPNGSTYREIAEQKEKWRKPLIVTGRYRASFFGNVINLGNTTIDVIRNKYYYAKFHESNKLRKQVEFADGSKRDRLPMRSAVYIDNQMKKDIHSVIYGAFKNA
jgi:hypothetical protein